MQESYKKVLWLTPGKMIRLGQNVRINIRIKRDNLAINKERFHQKTITPGHMHLKSLDFVVYGIQELQPISLFFETTFFYFLQLPKIGNTGINYSLL